MEYCYWDANTVQILIAKTILVLLWYGLSCKKSIQLKCLSKTYWNVFFKFSQFFKETKGILFQHNLFYSTDSDQTILYELTKNHKNIGHISYHLKRLYCSDVNSFFNKSYFYENSERHTRDMQKCSYITESNNNLKCLCYLEVLGGLFLFCFSRIYNSSIFFETFPSQILKKV